MNQVSVTASGSNTATASQSTTIVPAPAGQLTVSKIDDVDPAPVGSTVNYTIKVTNTGTGPVSPVTLTDTPLR